MRPSFIRLFLFSLLVCCILGMGISPAQATYNTPRSLPSGNIAASTPTPTNSANSTPESDDDGHIGLPKGCGGVTPGGEPLRSCCISGYVWMDGQAINGAEVTITAEKNGRSLTLLTAFQEDSNQPYYYTSLSGLPLDIIAGDVITVTARYSSHERSIRYIAKAGGQQVDVVLSKNSPDDYMYDAQSVGVQEDGRFNSPVSIDNDSSGNLYILDIEASTVQKFDRDGVFTLKWGGRGHEHSQFLYPHRLFVDRNDNVYVVDTGNGRVEKFSSTGEFIQQFGASGKGPGLLSKPQDVVVDSQGVVYIADFLGIHTFTAEGAYVTTWESVKPKNDYEPPVYYLAIDSFDRIIAYTYAPSISIFSNKGALLSSWNDRLSFTEDYPYFAQDIEPVQKVR